jgi:cell volume regulation protein A
MIFNAVFFIVLASALIQGATLERFARWLRVVEELPAAPAHAAQPLEHDLKVGFTVEANHSIAGVMIKEVGLPRQARIAVVNRGGKRLKLQAETVLQAGDRLSVSTPKSLYPEIEDVLERWRRRV